MGQVLRLQVVEFAGPSQWRWLLTGADGSRIAEHEVNLDASCWQFEALQDLYGYLRWHAAPDRRLADEARIVAEVGRWVGEQVFGPVGSAMAARPPATIHVLIPEAAQIVALYPLESAIVAGHPLALQRICLVFDVATSRHPNRVKQPVGQRLRLLGLFSLPEGSSALNLRKERYGLTRQVEEIAATRHLAVELQVLQYGVTRQQLRELVEHAEGWDILHLSGHGRAGRLVLEKPDGSPDPVAAGELATLLEPLAQRVKLIIVSACSSAALMAADQLHTVALASGVETDEQLPQQDVPGDAPDTGGGVTNLAIELACRLDATVLAMRFPVTDDLAVALAAGLYGAVLGEGKELHDALAEVLPSLAANGPTLEYPALSAGTPAIFGALAVRASLRAPRSTPAPNGRGLPKTASLPPQPERFVGRAGVITRASTALASASDARGVVLHGMAGAGKTTCAAELVHTHVHRFDAVAWFKAPDEGADTSDALSRFALILEGSVPGLEFVHLLGNVDALCRFLPKLTAFTARSQVLVVVDGAESLLTPEGAWQDERWSLVLQALTTIQGLWRTVITSRRPIAGLDGRLAQEAVHALDLDEAVLLARDLPHLRALLDGHAPGLGSTAARQLAGRVLAVAQGHPTLLELANGQAEDMDRLRALLTTADHAWIAHGGLPQGFFAAGQSTASAADYTDLLTTWTRTAAQGLPHNARILFWFLSCLQEADRSGPYLDGIIKATWAEVWEQSGLPGRVPATRDLMGAVVQRALAETNRDPADGHLAGCRMHPLVAAAAREQAGMDFQTAVDTALASCWTQTLLAAMHGEGSGESTGTVVLAGHSALSYLMRLGQWQAARFVLDEALVRDRSRSAVGAALPLARRLVRATVGTEEHLWTRWSLAQLTGWLDPAGGLAEAREVMAEAAKAGRYDVASIAAWNVVDACRLTGQLAEALEVASTMAAYSRRAGFGPLTKLLDEGARLRVLLAQGEHGQVLAEIDELVPRAEGLAETSDIRETTSRWNVLETLLDIGMTAAIERHRWEQALPYGERIAASQLQRSAPAHEAARNWFNIASALLGLGRTREAIEVLRACREVYEADGEVRMLGKVLTALATAEDERGHGPAALALVRDALRLAYRTGNPDDIAISHHNLGNYLARYGTDPAGAAIHYVSAALISTLTGSRARLDTCIESLARADLPEPQVLPANPAALAQAVNQIDGVHIDQLLDAVAPDSAKQQRALDHVLDRRKQARRQIPG